MLGLVLDRSPMRTPAWNILRLVGYDTAIAYFFDLLDDPGARSSAFRRRPSARDRVLYFAANPRRAPNSRPNATWRNSSST